MLTQSCCSCTAEYALSVADLEEEDSQFCPTCKWVAYDFDEEHYLMEVLMGLTPIQEVDE